MEKRKNGQSRKRTADKKWRREKDKIAVTGGERGRGMEQEQNRLEKWRERDEQPGGCGGRQDSTVDGRESQDRPSPLQHDARVSLLAYLLSHITDITPLLYIRIAETCTSFRLSEEQHPAYPAYRLDLSVSESRVVQLQEVYMAVMCVCVCVDLWRTI